VLNKTNKSHVQHFGNLSIALESVANFQGFASRIQPRGDARHNYDTVGMGCSLKYTTVEKTSFK
jgi:hypothetical protein